MASNYIAVDLHVHTCLSPCSSNNLCPDTVVKEAKKSGLDAIAITDHNSAMNVPAALAAGDKYGLTVIPGMEIETREEVHVLTLFASIEPLLAFENIVKQNLSAIANTANVFGHQLYYDKNNNLLGDYPQLLVQSTKLTLEKVVRQVLLLGGVPIPAHITRKANGILAVLGFIPPSLPIKTVEIDRNYYLKANIEEKLISLYNIIVNSDAHCIQDLYGQPITALKVTACNPKNILNKLKTKQSGSEVVIV